MPGPSTNSSAVEVQGLSKRFELPTERVHTVKERALHPLRRTRKESLEALREVSFAVEPGEFFGIVGRNGSGKSTLLKCIAGIYQADRGRITVGGRMAAFIELGVGFNPDLPARDNVLINAVMLGLTPAEARARFDSVIEFAELGEFVDLKLKNYSSGMQVRLAFAVMVQVDAEILLIDEVLAVGDAAFQQKCHETLQRRRREGTTILFVTHDMPTIQQVCDRAMLLDRGRVADIAAPERIARGYNELNFRVPGAPAPVSDGDRSGDGSAQLLDAWFEDDDGRRVTALEGRSGVFKMLVEIAREVSDPSFGVTLEDEQHRTIFVTSSYEAGERSGRFAAGDRVEVELRFENVLAPGRYLATPYVAHPGTGTKVMDLRRRMVSLAVPGARRGAGLIDLPHEFRLRREAPAARSAAT